MITNNIGTIGAHRAQTAAYWRRRARQTRNKVEHFRETLHECISPGFAVEFESFALRAEILGKTNIASTPCLQTNAPWAH